MTSHKTSHLIFLENQTQVGWVRESLSIDPKTKLVAVTAEALQKLEEYDLPHETIGIYNDSKQMRGLEKQNALNTYQLALEVESYIGQRYRTANFKGPGFLSSQGWYLQLILGLIATRVFLMRQVIQTCTPEIVTVFEDEINPWFAHKDSYIRNPWLDVIDEMSTQYNFRYEVIPLSPAPTNPFKNLLSWGHFLFARSPSAAWRRSNQLIREIIRKNSSSLANLRLLIVDSDGYDWRPVINTLESEGWAECNYLTSKPCNGNAFHPLFAYHPQLKTRWGRVVYPLEVGTPTPTPQEVQQLGELFDRWLTEAYVKPTLPVLDIELFSVWKTYLRLLTQYGPALLRYTDEIANQIFKYINPQVACFFSVHHLAPIRLAYQCRQHQIPVVGYQHGGAYGTHDFVAHEQMDFAHTDYLLTYGSNIQPSITPTFPIRTKVIPVGSARIETMKENISRLAGKKHNSAIKVLWIADFPSSNLFGVIHGEVEDTGRYLLEKQCLEILSQVDNMQVIYRPYRGYAHIDGISNWIKQTKPSSIQINTTHRLEELILSSDVIVSNNQGATIWNEVIGLKKPFILYCNPDIAPLKSPFISDLERACYWCRSEAEFIAAIERLAIEPAVLIAKLQQIDFTDFIQKYILYREDGKCKKRVISFLNTICQQEQLVKA